MLIFFNVLILDNDQIFGNYKSFTSLKRLIADLTVVAAVVEYT